MPNRSPRCENCGQKFSFGAEAEAPSAAIPAPPAPVIAPPVSEVRTTAVPSDAGDPTVPARLALEDATDQAVIGLGEPIPLPEPTDNGDDGPTSRASRAAAFESPIAPETRAITVDVPISQPSYSPALAPDIGVGKVLAARLEIVAELGNGPLGRVYKAVDRKKGSVVAVKAIPSSRLPEEALSGRFAETINLVKSLVHPNLVKVYGAGREGETAFTIEQYLEGLPLRALLDVKRENGGYFTFEEAEPIVAQICQGLSFAHASLVHGGMKPENVIIHVDSLKIVDLGLSRLFAPKEWAVVQREGRNGGAYLAPEFGDPSASIDRRADVYSVGAILYEMLTSRPPSGPDAAPVSTLNPSVPRAVDRVIAKAMARVPTDRYESAGEFKEAVMRVLGGDILADDLESPVGDLMETFVEDEGDSEKEMGIEIEYLETGPTKKDRDSKDSQDATPVGAIELHEPLWEPDELRTSREAPQPRSSPVGAVDEPLGHSDHISVDLPMEQSRGAEATATGMGPGAPEEAERARGLGPVPNWLEKVEPSRPSAPAMARPSTSVGPSSRGMELELREASGSPLELDDPVIVPPEPPSKRFELPPPAPPTPTRRPTPTPAPWDGRRSQSGAQPIAKSPSGAQPVAERDRPTDAPISQNDRVTAPRPRIDDPVRALSPANPPSLGLNNDGPTNDNDLDRPTDERANDRAIEAAAPRVESPAVRRGDSGLVRRPTGANPRVYADAPTSPPRPNFVVRRQSSKAPLILFLLLFFGASLAGGGWLIATHTDALVALVPHSTGERCPAGMAYFGPGAFPFGSEKLDPDRSTDEPFVHKVSTEGFCIDKYEFPGKEGEMPLVNLPVTQAEVACTKIGKRLCTESEWERACKGPDGTRFPYGDTYKPGVCNVGASDHPGAPRSSGTFPLCARTDGVFDMSGNVWEMTSTPWTVPGGLHDDPKSRVIKGGSAKLAPWGARCSYRDLVEPDAKAEDIGFRCCEKAR